jgi:hypothetical protein
VTQDIPVFEYVETFKISGRGTLYCGPSPFDDPLRVMTWIGTKVMIDGEVRTIRGTETYMSFVGPRKGSPIGLLFTAENKEDL